MAWHTARVGKTLNQLGMTPTPSPSIFFALLFVSAACTPSVDAGSGYRGRMVSLLAGVCGVVKRQRVKWPREQV